MARPITCRIACVIGCLAATTAAALDYRSLTEAAVMYDAPSAKARPLFAIARGTPVEVVVAIEGWVKVRDAKGDLAWVEKRLVSDKRNVMVRADRAQFRSEAEEKAPLVFEAEKDVLLELLEPAPAGWAKVKHRDGQIGFVKVSQVWGL
jgi:SH3-like domain-containing protein